MAETPYSTTELLACVATRLLEDRKSVFVGTGLPMIAAMLAQRTHAPGLLIIFEAGGIGPQTRCYRSPSATRAPSTKPPPHPACTM